MKANPIPMLPAKHFVFPILRPLLTMMKCLKAMMRFDGSEITPVVLKRESISNAGFLSKALTELCKRAGIDSNECKFIISALRNPSLWKSNPVDLDAFRLLLGSLEDFCKKHKPALAEAYRQDKEFFSKLYRESVLKRRLLVIHSKNDAPDVLKKNLSSGAYYEVDTLEVGQALEKSAKHHITLFLCSDSNEAMEFFLREKRIDVDLFLSNLGREIPVLNMNLCRMVNQAQRKGMKFVAPPYVPMKLLPSLEETYVHRLEEFDKAVAAQEGAQAQEDEALFRGMEEAVLYAELIVESHWKKTAGHSMEQTLLEAGH